MCCMRSFWEMRLDGQVGARSLEFRGFSKSCSSSGQVIMDLEIILSLKALGDKQTLT